MGKIEETIYENYKRAIVEGDYDQAKLAAELGQILKQKIELSKFVDYETLKVPITKFIGRYFNPFPYRYDVIRGIVELETGIITLTKLENKIFSLFSENETQGKDIRIITPAEIAQAVWSSNQKKSLIRINIMRLRQKLEPDPNNPQILLSVPRKGYIFLGHKVSEF